MHSFHKWGIVFSAVYPFTLKVKLPILMRMKRWCTCVTTHMKDIEHYIHVLLFRMLYKGFLTFKLAVAEIKPKRVNLSIVSCGTSISNFHLESMKTASVYSYKLKLLSTNSMHVVLFVVRVKVVNPVNIISTCTVNNIGLSHYSVASVRDPNQKCDKL